MVSVFCQCVTFLSEVPGAAVMDLSMILNCFLSAKVKMVLPFHRLTTGLFAWDVIPEFRDLHLVLRQLSE